MVISPGGDKERKRPLGGEEKLSVRNWQARINDLRSGMKGPQKRGWRKNLKPSLMPTGCSKNAWGLSIELETGWGFNELTRKHQDISKQSTNERK